MGFRIKPPVDAELLYEWGDESLTETHQKKYLEYFREVPGPVLEIGCGRGVVLRLLKEAGIEAYGLDTSEEAVDICVSRGLNAIHADAVNHMSSIPMASLGGIFCGHVIEHMEPNKAIEFLREGFRIIKPGGFFIIITPNPKDLRTTERFWLDVTHVRPYPEKLLIALLKKEGFKDITVSEDREPARNILERFVKVFLRIWFMGFMFRGDLVVVAKR
jgi:SAM-dependent methyltransferase